MRRKSKRKMGPELPLRGLGLKGGITGKAGELLLEGFLDKGNFTLVL